MVWERGDYDTQRCRQRRQRILEFLGGKCVMCGSTEGLEVDHIDRHTKSFTLSDKPTAPWVVIVEELKKCQLLCTPCHLEKSRLAGDLPPASVCGTNSKYTHGCRCDLCKVAHNTYMREYKRRMRD